MRRMHCLLRYTLVMLAALLCALPLGCAPAETAKKIALCLPPAGEGWSASLLPYAREAALGWEGEVYAAVTPEIPGGLIEAAQAIVQEKANIAVMYAYDPVEGERAAQILADAGIPLILVGNAVNTEHYAALVTADNLAIGRAAGEYLADRMGGEGAVLVLEGMPGEGTDLRNQGFREALAAYPGMEIAASEDCGDSREVARTQVMLLMQKYPEVLGIFAHTDETALGAITSLEEIYADVEAVVSVGGGKEAVANLLNNHRYLKVTWSYPPTVAADAVRLAIGMLDGDAAPPEDKRVLLPADPIDPTNARERYNENSTY